ncbi:MAG: aspartate carbamoyltransferase regulatory subunit [Candidatus Bathyarchaeota archaeon]|jgi:aspartate carbamoyltransferase regulatory subunit|nr:aspartate carbamoyltransferase regulatory subunit [Candidatus Bathyarchaeota archaeon]MDD4325347.1 aspartate carbamoyltransferase regulatory subunit [Candidatus Bathyarchaeota archaeon]MDI9576600.1 aspartate carbamoyltransferase regulatory subunit [Thermoproteota archaeon]MDT8782175.1 aspartate carbamoyltransferase regulatory subunit [Candidatus Bathyarchaeota archaeon]NLD66447.1 aspartate carbamoyltransferase regulatory subunit [Thermoproteota archaeon]
MSDKELRVSKIKDGTVIDHIRGGYALDVVNILGITGKEKRVMTIAINVSSKRLGVKDIVKIEGKALSMQEVNRIALVAPHASINIIHNYIVNEKFEVKLPKTIEGIIKCNNPNCVSNSGEPVVPKFYVKQHEPLLLKCYYCGITLEQLDVMGQL